METKGNCDIVSYVKGTRKRRTKIPTRYKWISCNRRNLGRITCVSKRSRCVILPEEA